MASSEGHTRYTLMHEVAEVAIKKGGTIFGGFVRSFIFHDHMAKKFYGDGHDRKDYETPDVSPETFEGRTHIPSDIDIHFKTNEEFSEFRKTLSEMSFAYIPRRKRLNGYTITHWTLKVRLVVVPMGVRGSVSHRNLVKYVKNMDVVVPGSDFSIDVVVDSNNLPPFSDKLDFVCNGLIMNSDGINLCEQLAKTHSVIGKFRLLNSIIDDIVNKRAYVVKFTAHRWEKMDAKKTWEILGENFPVNKTFPEKGEDCIICHCDENVNYKLACCNAFYHLNCLKRTLKHDSTKCAHCRQGIFFDYDDEYKKFVGIDI